LIGAKPFLAGTTQIALTAGLPVRAGDLVINLDPRHSLTDRQHVAGYLMPRNERKFDQMTEGAVADQEVVITNATRADTDKHLVTARLRWSRPALDL
jgi:hypothetical protein